MHFLCIASNRRKTRAKLRRSSWILGAIAAAEGIEDGWDGPAAEARIFEKAGFDGDDPDVTWARKAFLAYDAANPKLKSFHRSWHGANPPRANESEAAQSRNPPMSQNLEPLVSG
jgi:hypothetical protein